MLVTPGAAPAALRPSEAAQVFIAKEHQCLMTPVAPHHVRIAEQVFAEEIRCMLSFTAVERIAAEHAFGGGADGLSIHVHC
jgi:hypothetical protein